MAERIQKILSSAGVASRRKAEKLIVAGRVQVNGKPASLGDRAEPGVDLITVDGEPIAAQAKRYLALNKPAGYVTTVTDTHGRPTVVDLVKVRERVYPVGRLDLHTSGLLLLTSDGDFAERVTHPRYEIEKTYIVRIARPLGAAALRKLQSGIELEDGPLRPAKVSITSDDRRTVEMTIHEGRNRIVRRALEAVGSRVVELRRTRIGPVDLGSLPSGKWRELTQAEIDGLSRG
ncbi:MAG: rRNA pseudouridine synthase [Chloroflexi bacterium]|nr:rRNA pseudouridine synthase [Chloroflexota bacterium]